MRNDAHLHAEHPTQVRGRATELLWILSFAALLVFLVMALAGWVK
jgi:hypothetical protein